MFVFIVTLILLLQTIVREFPVLNAETTTEMFSLAPLAPGHAENSVSLKPAENLDRFTSSPSPAVVSTQIKSGSTQRSTTARPLESTTGATSCAPWFVCVHGNCREGMSCSCHAGWAGLLCDEPCPEKCAPYGMCVTSSSNQAVCVCNETSVYTSAVGCVDTPPEPERSTLATASGEATPSAATTPTTGNLASPGDRDCFGIFTCVHGSCQAMSLACDCDSGWKGQLCDQPCELSCGEHGKCREKDFIQYCECDYPFTGDDCTNMTSITLEASTAAPEPIPSITDLDLDSSDWFHLARSPNSDSATRNNTVLTDPHVGVLGSGSSKDGTSTLRPHSQRQCVSGVVCQHGHCPKGEIACLCDRGWGGTFCHLTCDLPCGENQTCIVHDGESPYCQCGPGHSNEGDCHLPEEESLPTAWIVCLGSVSSVLSVAMLIVLPVYLYKRQNITMMKIVHWFQPFEEDDCKEYDAFVSYSSSDHDRQFVLQTLVPRLEGRMCFTLCIHQRNLVAGQSVSDNIAESVKRSRRTLLVVSPSFVSSGWCRFEYQTALQEMLSEKHRVLSIIIGDVSSVRNQIDDTLKRIQRTVTWLEYPAKCSNEQEYEQFWKRLQLSMPKKRSAQIELVTTQSCLASPTSAWSTKDPKDEDALPTSYLLANECSNTGLIQRIVRIPANREDFHDVSLQSGSTALGKILEARQDKDSHDGTAGSSVGSTPSDSANSEPPATNSFSGESCPDSDMDNPEMEAASLSVCLSAPLESPDSNMDNSEMEAASHTLESSDPSDTQHASSDTTSQCTNPNPDLDSHHDCSDVEELPACMVDSYLGTLEIRNAVTV